MKTPVCRHDGVYTCTCSGESDGARDGMLAGGCIQRDFLRGGDSMRTCIWSTDVQFMALSPMYFHLFLLFAFPPRSLITSSHPPNKDSSHMEKVWKCIAPILVRSRLSAIACIAEPGAAATPADRQCFSAQPMQWAKFICMDPNNAIIASLETTPCIRPWRPMPLHSRLPGWLVSLLRHPSDDRALFGCCATLGRLRSCQQPPSLVQLHLDLNDGPNAHRLS